MNMMESKSYAIVFETPIRTECSFCHGVKDIKFMDNSNPRRFVCDECCLKGEKDEKEKRF